MRHQFRFFPVYFLGQDKDKRAAAVSASNSTIVVANVSQKVNRGEVMIDSMFPALATSSRLVVFSGKVAYFGGA